MVRSKHSSQNACKHGKTFGFLYVAEHRKHSKSYASFALLKVTLAIFMAILKAELPSFDIAEEGVQLIIPLSKPIHLIGS